MRVRQPIGNRVDGIAEDFICVKASSTHSSVVRVFAEIDEHGTEFLCVLFAMLRVNVARIVTTWLIRRPAQTREMLFPFTMERSPSRHLFDRRRRAGVEPDPDRFHLRFGHFSVPRTMQLCA